MILTAQRASHLTTPIVRTLVIQLHTDCWATFSLLKPWPLLLFPTPFYSSYRRKCAKAERERQRVPPCVSPLIWKGKNSSQKLLLDLHWPTLTIALFRGLWNRWDQLKQIVILPLGLSTLPLDKIRIPIARKNGRKGRWLATESWRPQLLTNHGLFGRSLRLHCPLCCSCFLPGLLSHQGLQDNPWLSLGFSVLEQSYVSPKYRDSVVPFPKWLCCAHASQVFSYRGPLPQCQKLLSLGRSDRGGGGVGSRYLCLPDSVAGDCPPTWISSQVQFTLCYLENLVLTKQNYSWSCEF